MTESPEQPAAAAEAARPAHAGAAPQHGAEPGSSHPRRSARAGAHSRRTRRPAPGSAFYAGALDAADRLDLKHAAAVRGIDQEIAVLRLRIRRSLSDHPEDFALTVRSIELLVRAVGAAGKHGADDSSEVLDRIYAELGGIVALIADAADPDPPI